jgi:3-oxoacyl-ACP reductase-like protein
MKPAIKGDVLSFLQTRDSGSGIFRSLTEMVAQPEFLFFAQRMSFRRGKFDMLHRYGKRKEPLMNATDTSEFSGKRVLVTGGTKGGGKAIAERFLQGGATVDIAARSAPTEKPRPLHPSRRIHNAGHVEGHSRNVERV